MARVMLRVLLVALHLLKMITMSNATTCAKLMSLGVPKETSSNIITLLDKWVTNNGVEWTIDHLKDIKQTFIGKLASTDLPTKTWVKKRPDGFPSGPLTTTFLKQGKVTPRRLSRALTILSAHSMFIAPQCTAKQKEKFFGSMTSLDRTGMEARFHILPGKMKGHHDPHQTVRPFLEFCVSNTHRAPGPDLRTVKENDFESVLQHAVKSAPIFGIVMQYRNVASKVLPIEDYHFQCMQQYKERVYTKRVMMESNFGVISGIQEPGFKLRAVANPSRIVQAMLEPLKTLVMDHLKTLPTDHTHDQLGAIPKVQAMLRSGQTVHSVDLSDATNLFPLPLQVDMLRKMVPPNYDDFVDIFEKVSTGPWLTKLRGEPEIVQFSRGQPLGLGPSFGVFALAHNILLEGLCKKIGLKSEDHFVVLGDDVVIRGDELNRLYRSTLQNLGCQVSESKTISSRNLAEFAGFVILPDMVGKGYKWRDVSDASFVDMVRNLGPKVQGYLHPWQRDYIKLIAPVPIQLGGLGWSGNRTLAEAMELPMTGAFISLLANREKEPVLYRDLVPLATRVIYSLQGKSFLPYYGENPTSVRSSGVSGVWPARVFEQNDTMRDRGIIPPPFLLAEPGDPGTQGLSVWTRPVGDPRPGSLRMLKTMLGLDPGLVDNISKTLLKRLTSDNSPIIPFTQIVEVVKKDPIRQFKRTDNGMSI